MKENFLKIGKATELTGRNYYLYRFFEILPGFLALATFGALIYLSRYSPIEAAYIIIAFDFYWLLMVSYFGIHLVSSFRKMQDNMKVDWELKCKSLKKVDGSLGFGWSDVIQLVILPTCNESLTIVSGSIESIARDGFRNKNKIFVLAVEERAGRNALKNARMMEDKYSGVFRNFVVTVHPSDIPGEIHGKGSNQAWAIRKIKKDVIDKDGIDADKILVSVLDADSIVVDGYFFCLTYKFLTTRDPYRASYQPIPVYHNNIWDTSFVTRIAASSNTFWQMIQQVRYEKLATYSSHSMTYRALVDIDFWSTNMVSEDSRIFWHCSLFYKGDYRVEPLFFPISMDACMDHSLFSTLRNLYKQQRRWGWGVENVPYLLFNTIKTWKVTNRRKMMSHAFVQIYGFHSWATNALIIAVIGWMPLWLGGDVFNSTVISSNLPIVTKNLMRLAMIGLIVSAIVSRLMLPRDPVKATFKRKIMIMLEWVLLPFTIIIFGAIPALEAQIRLMFKQYLGFWTTPKAR